MKVVQKHSSFVTKENKGTDVVPDIPMSKCICSVESKKAYILNDKGFRDQFGKDWKLVKIIVLAWLDSILDKGIVKLDYSLITKYDDPIHAAAWSDIVHKYKRPRVEKAIRLLFYNGDNEYEEHRSMLMCALFGGEGKNKSSIKTRQGSGS